MQLRRYRPMAVLLLALHLQACMSWRRTTISPAQLIAEEEPSSVRVTLANGSQLTLVDPTIRNDSRVHEDGRVYVVVSDVSTVEVRGFSMLKTMPVILGGLLFIVACPLGAADCTSDW